MRIGINVPNELLQRVKAIRPEVNVSQVCREALEEIVSDAQRLRAMVATSGIDGHVASLANSDNYIPEPDWQTYGWEDAIEWANSVSPDDWRECWNIYESDLRNGKGDYLPGPYFCWYTPGVKRFYNRERANEAWFQQQSKAGGIGNPYREAERKYDEAWFDCASEVKRLVEQHRKEKQDRMISEREAAWRSHPQPELPPQLLD